MAAYTYAGGNNNKRRETRGYRRLPSRTKVYQLQEETLIQTAGGQTGTWANPTIRYPKELVRIPVLGGSSQLLVESPRPLGLEMGKLLENWGRGLDKQAC